MKRLTAIEQSLDLSSHEVEIVSFIDCFHGSSLGEHLQVINMFAKSRLRCANRASELMKLELGDAMLDAAGPLECK